MQGILVFSGLAHRLEALLGKSIAHQALFDMVVDANLGENVVRAFDTSYNRRAMSCC